jgi:hypothetical protein
MLKGLFIFIYLNNIPEIKIYVLFWNIFYSDSKLNLDMDSAPTRKKQLDPGPGLEGPTTANYRRNRGSNFKDLR